MTKHEGHIPTSAAMLPEFNPSGWTGKQATIVITVEHCGCSSFSRSVDPAANRRFKKIPGATGTWRITDAEYAFRSNGNYCLSNITYRQE